MYHVAGYRRKVIKENLRNSFPEKTDQELHAIEKRYYKFMCDLFLETLKFYRVKPSVVQKRFKITNPEFLQPYKDNNQSVILMASHYGNWEWMVAALPLMGMHKMHGIYKPIKKKSVDRCIYEMRTQFGQYFTSMKNTMRALVQYRKETTMLTLGGDQAASGSDFFCQFLNQPTATYLGVEKISRKFNYPVIYIKVVAVKRGYYELSFEKMTDEPAKEEEFAIVKHYLRLLERDIQESPAFWLWSHRRWKRKPGPDTIVHPIHDH